MSSRRVAGTVCSAAVFVGVLLGACKSDDAKQDKTAGSAATMASGVPAAPAVSSAASTASADNGGSPGGCKRLKPGTSEPMCNLAKEYCCENVAGGQEKCVAHKEAKGLQCGDDGAWRVAIGCSTSSMCGPAQKCCVQEPAPGFLQTVCAPTCQHEEVCVPNLSGGSCKDPASFDCVASDTSRTGGRCIAKTTAGSKVAQCAKGQVRIASPGSPGGVCTSTCTGMGITCPSGRVCGGVSTVNDDGSIGDQAMACNPRPTFTGGDAICNSITPNPMLHPCGAGMICGPVMDYSDGKGVHSPCVKQ
jgi:hypothetical protein